MEVCQKIIAAVSWCSNFQTSKSECHIIHKDVIRKESIDFINHHVIFQTADIVPLSVKKLAFKRLGGNQAGRVWQPYSYKEGAY